MEGVLDVKVSCLPHHSFANDKYLVEVGRLKSSVMEGGGETPAAEVARLLQHVNPALVWCTVNGFSLEGLGFHPSMHKNLFD